MRVSQKLPTNTTLTKPVFQEQSEITAAAPAKIKIENDDDHVENIYAKTKEKESVSWKNLVDLTSIDLNALKEGTLRISVPFKAGHYTLPGLYADADVKVKKNTHAFLSIAVGQNENHEAIMKGANLEFNPPLKIKNPASAFEHSHYLADKIKDLLADIILRGFAISKEGKISLDGAISKGVFGEEDLGSRMKASHFPSVDMNLKTLFDSKLKSLPLSALKKNPLGHWKFFDVLKQIGAMTERAQYELKLKTDPIHIAGAYKEFRLWTEKSVAEINFRGSAKITNSGEIEVASNQLESQIATKDVTVHIGGEGVISNLDKSSPTVLAHVAMRAEVKKVAGDTTQLGIKIPFTVGGEHDDVSGHAFVSLGSGHQLKLKDASSLALRMHARLPANFSVRKDPGALQIGSSELQMKAGVNLEFDKKLQINSGAALLKAKMANIEVEAVGYRGIMLGEAGVGINARHIQKPALEKYPSFAGEAQYSFTPAPAPSSAKVPGFKAFTGILDYQFKSDNTLSLESHESGLTQMVSPLMDLVWSPTSISDPKTPAAGAIGSLAWRKKIEEITSAPIRKGNQVKLLVDGVMSYPEKLAMIQNAKKSIYIQALVFKDDETGMSIAKALVDAKNRGVDVRVIVDSIGNIESLQAFFKGNQIYRLLEKNQVNFKLFNGALEEGLREVVEVVASNEKLQEKMIVAMSDMSQAMSVLHFIVQAASGNNEVDLNASNREKILVGLSRVWGGIQGIEPQEAVTQLSALTADNTIYLSEVAQILKQMAGINHRWHEKYFIVDGEKAILGSMNVADEHLLGGTVKLVGEPIPRPAWRDVDVLLTGPCVQDAYRHFSDNWEIVSGKRLPALQSEGSNSNLEIENGIDVQVVHGRPRIDGDHHMVNLFIESIKALNPGDKFYTAIAYFIPSGAFEPYAEALIDAAKRGVDVRVVTNSEKSTDLQQVVKAAKSVSYRKLLKSGVRLFECSGDRTLHTKATAMGSRVAIVGSANANNRTGSLDSESVAVLHDAKLTKEVENVILADMDPAVAHEIRLEDVEYGTVLNQLENAAFALLKDCM